jgi:hypothetical protein
MQPGDAARYPQGMRRFAVLGAALALVASTAGASSATTVPSGLRGAAVFFPARPVCLEDDPCTKPAAGIVLVFTRTGVPARRTTTGVDGSYRIRLRPGVWAVKAVTEPRLGSGITPRIVRVPKGRFARVDFTIDTGLQ